MSEIMKKMANIGKIADFLKKGVPLYLTHTETGQFMSFNDVEKSVTPLKNAVLEHYLWIDDIVIMNASKENVKENVPNGTFGVVTGYHVYQRAIGYADLWLSKHTGKDGVGQVGIFEKNGAAIITWINGEVTQGHAGDIHNVTDDRGHQRPGAKEFEEEHDKATFIRDLPVLPIWPGDTVELNKVFFSDPGSCGETKQVYVERVGYDDVDEKCNDGSPFPIYTIRPLYENGPSMAVREYITAQEEHDRVLAKWEQASTPVEVDDDIYIKKLVKRGNYWAWFNDKSKLEFGTFEDEIRFYTSLGLVVQVPAPEGGYNWEAHAVTKAMREDKICFFKSTGRWQKFNAWDIPGDAELKKHIGKRFAEFYAGGHHLEA